MNDDSQKELREARYWDARYSGIDDDKAGSHEWFRSFKDLQSFLLKKLPEYDPHTNAPRILHLGCGTSTLTADLYRLGYQNQCNVDFSSVAIDLMKDRHVDLGGLDWLVMDVRDMKFADKAFDFAIDKGTLDAMIWGSLWNPEDQVIADAKAYVDEVCRILKPGGRWVYITYRQPHFMKQFIQREGQWTVEVETLGGQDGTFEYFGFVMTKEIARADATAS